MSGFRIYTLRRKGLLFVVELKNIGNKLIAILAWFYMQKILLNQGVSYWV